MKKSYKYFLGAALFCTAFAQTSCTDGFEAMNTDPSGIDINGTVTDIVDRVQNPLDNVIPPNEHRYQIWANLTTDIFAGFFMGVNDFGGSNNYNYLLRPDHTGQTYTDYYLYIGKYTKDYIPQCKKLERYELAAMLQVADVLGMLPVVSSYGPAQYKCMKENSDVYYYDTEETIYSTMFEQLEEALQWMKAFRDSGADEQRMADFTRADKICGGNVDQWIKMINTLRLRIAMQLVKVQPEKSRKIAEEAVADGVLTEADNDVILKSGFKLFRIEDLWNDTRVNASFVSVLEGYSDPRLGRLLALNNADIYQVGNDETPVVEKNTKVLGVRQGVPMTRTEYLGFSKTSRQAVPEEGPRPLMRVAEAYFLRAEGVLRGWNMGGGTAEELYEKGIFCAWKSVLGDPSKWQGDYDNYIEGTINMGDDSDFDWNLFEGGFGSAAYENPRDPRYNYGTEVKYTDMNGEEQVRMVGPNRVSVKWHEEDDNEKKLQRIITQKWIAFFPTLSVHAWTDFRRTGYPKLIPIPADMNYSNGTIDTELMIRRLPFTQGEYRGNREEVMKAVNYLKGPDNGGTRLWWDVEGGNF